MDTKALPTTATAVQADLKARANFRGIDEAGQIHYLYGMATAMLARANDREARLLAALTALVDASELVQDDHYSTTVDEAISVAKSAIYITKEMCL